MLYSDLLNYIQQYTENVEPTFVANIPTFVRLTEEVIYRHAALPLQSKNGTLTCTPGTSALTLPSDFLNFDYIYVVDGGGITYMLLNKEVDYLFQAFPDPTYKAVPSYYSVRDNNTILVYPIPDQAYILNFQYVYFPPSIVDVNTTWLGTNATNALLYGTLMHAYIYMKGEDTLQQKYQSMFENALSKVKELGEGLERADGFRNVPPRPLPEPNN